MLTRDDHNPQARGAQSLFIFLCSRSLAIVGCRSLSVFSKCSFFSLRGILLLLLMLGQTVALSIDGNLGHGQHNQEWSVDDWWHQMNDEDFQRHIGTSRSMSERLHLLPSTVDTVRSRSFLPTSQINEHYHSQLGDTLFHADGDVHFSMPTIGFQESKRRWPVNQVHFPTFPRTSSAAAASFGGHDLDTSESMAMKTSVGGKHGLIECECNLLSCFFNRLKKRINAKLESSSKPYQK